jgi:tetratricopeptide (TPR) repeat protein
MKTTIPLAERLLLKGRKLHQLGLDAQAMRIFESLSHFHNLPAQVRSETHRRLAKLNTKGRKFKRARRHLAPLLAQNPDNAEYQYRMARLVEADVHCDSGRAREHYRKALRLDPNNPRYLSGYGLFALDSGRPRTALALLRRAHRLSPDHPQVLRRYLTALQKMHRFGEAREVLEQSRFRLGKKGWFAKLRLDCQFAALHHRQHAGARDQTGPAEEQPCLLPFPQATALEPPKAGFEYVRSDRPSVLATPHLKGRRIRPDQRHAQ